MKWTPDSKVLIQGIDEPLGRYYATRLQAFGMQIVAGVAVGRGGETALDIPVFDLVEEAVSEIKSCHETDPAAKDSRVIETSLIFVPPYRVLDAALEAIEAGIEQLIIISAGVPPLDMVKLMKKAQTTQTLILGPGSHGVIVPSDLWLGICEPQFYQAGTIGLITRDGRLGDEVAKTLTEAGYGQSMAVSLGSDGILGSSLEQWLQVFEEDDNTEVIVLVSQIGGKAEIEAAKYIAESIEKPVIVYIAGLHSPMESRFGDADTIISTQLSYSVAVMNTRGDLPQQFKEAGAFVAKRLSDLPDLVKKALA